MPKDRRDIDKALRIVEGLALYSFKMATGCIMHTMDLNPEQAALDMICQAMYCLRIASQMHYCRQQNENGDSARFLNPRANTINSHVNLESAQHAIGAHIIANAEKDGG
jgi:hypothetical protein